METLKEDKVTLYLLNGDYYPEKQEGSKKLTVVGKKMTIETTNGKSHPGISVEGTNLHGMPTILQTFQKIYNNRGLWLGYYKRCKKHIFLSQIVSVEF